MSNKKFNDEEFTNTRHDGGKTISGTKPNSFREKGFLDDAELISKPGSIYTKVRPVQDQTFDFEPKTSKKSLAASVLPTSG
jgi:hypothetical protein